MNIFQAALKLREDFAHTGIDLEYAGANNLYLIFHDALHYFLGAEPKEEDEPIVLVAELLFGGKEWDNIPALSNVDIDDLITRISQINSELVEIFIDFYTNYYS